MSNQTTDFAPWFRSKSHEFDSCKFGMWLFLAQEIMLFGGLFVAFILFNYMYPEMFREAHHHLNKIMGAVNTVVLLISSLTMALAIAYVQRNKMNKAMLNLVLTFLCASAFMVIKYFEYSHKIHAGLLPGAYFTFQGMQASNASLFFSLYFMMTGLHGIHVVGGMACLLWLMWRLKRNKITADNFGSVEFVGLYWHLVDLIWIFLFPLFYLVV